MIETIATISVLDEAIIALDNGRPRYEIKDSLKSYRDKYLKKDDPKSGKKFSKSDHYKKTRERYGNKSY